MFHNEDPMMVLIEYLKMKNLRLLDLFKSLDSNGSHSINHKEFRVGLTVRPIVPAIFDENVNQRLYS